MNGNGNNVQSEVLPTCSNQLSLVRCIVDPSVQCETLNGDPHLWVEVNIGEKIENFVKRLQEMLGIHTDIGLYCQGFRLLSSYPTIWCTTFPEPIVVLPVGSSKFAIEHYGTGNGTGTGTSATVHVPKSITGFLPSLSLPLTTASTENQSLQNSFEKDSPPNVHNEPDNENTQNTAIAIGPTIVEEANTNIEAKMSLPSVEILTPRKFASAKSVALVPMKFASLAKNPDAAKTPAQSQIQKDGLFPVDSTNNSKYNNNNHSQQQQPIRRRRRNSLNIDEIGDDKNKKTPTADEATNSGNGTPPARRSQRILGSSKLKAISSPMSDTDTPKIKVPRGRKRKFIEKTEYISVYKRNKRGKSPQEFNDVKPELAIMAAFSTPKNKETELVKPYGKGGRKKMTTSDTALLIPDYFGRQPEPETPESSKSMLQTVSSTSARISGIGNPSDEIVSSSSAPGVQLQLPLPSIPDGLLSTTTTESKNSLLEIQMDSVSMPITGRSPVDCHIVLPNGIRIDSVKQEENIVPKMEEAQDQCNSGSNYTFDSNQFYDLININPTDRKNETTYFLSYSSSSDAASDDDNEDIMCF